MSHQPDTALPIPSASALREFHDAANRTFFSTRVLQAPPDASNVWVAIGRNHENNMRLWAEEDLARRRHAPDSDIVANKRLIDAFNQARNDAIEQIDDLILHSLGDRSAHADARLNSETAGSMIDRLSIASLKRYHMGLQLERTDVDAGHIATCRARLERLEEQTSDLLGCLFTLLRDCQSGTAKFKTYRQYKMYNDPALNPWLVRETADRAKDSAVGT